MTGITDLYCFIDIGANPSAEEGGGDELDSRTEQVIDICDAFRLQPTEPKHIDKKAYKDHLKGGSLLLLTAILE